jgi:hypothetical protein
MNSPSRMSQLMPWMTLTLPKAFWMFLNETDAIAGLQDLTAPAVRPDTM